MRKWVLGVALLIVGSAGAQTVTAVPQLDLEKYVGTWYEIARYPDKAQKKCLSDALELYSLGEKPRKFMLVTSCRGKGEFAEVRNGNGKVLDKGGAGKVKVTYVWPFSKKYWVLAVGPSYEWALEGTANHKVLRVLSRTVTLKPEVMAEITGKAAGMGFDVGKLVAWPVTR